MIKVEKRPYGLYVTLSGDITPDQVRKYETDVNELWPPEAGPRSSIMDIRELLLPNTDALQMLMQFFPRAKENGLQRLAIIVKSPGIKARAIQLAFEVDRPDMIRFFDTSKTADWQVQSLDWVIHGFDPIDLPTDSTDKIQVN